MLLTVLIEVFRYFLKVAMIGLTEEKVQKDGPLGKVADFIQRRRYVIIGFWFALCIASAYLFTSLKKNVSFTFGPPHDR